MINAGLTCELYVTPCLLLPIDANQGTSVQVFPTVQQSHLPCQTMCIADPTGFEPATYCSASNRTIQAMQRVRKV